MAGPVLEARNLTKHFPVRQGVFARAKGVVHADLIVPYHDRLCPELAQIVDEIPGETVVIIDDEEHFSPASQDFRPIRPRGRPWSRNRGRRRFPAGSLWSNPSTATTGRAVPMIARALGRSSVAMILLAQLRALVELGTTGYPPKTRRRAGTFRR